MRSVLLAKGPDSSFGGVPVGYCPNEVHMEEEGVQVQVCDIRVDVVVAPRTSWCALGSASWALPAEISCVVSGMAEHTMFRETCFDV